MPSPYRHHPSPGARSVQLPLHTEVWASALGVMAITLVAGVALCATAEGWVGIAAGGLLLVGTLAMVPISTSFTAPRPVRLEIERSIVRLVYADGTDRRIDYLDLLIHRVSTGRVALDREGEMVVYVEELTVEARREVMPLLIELAGYDVLAPEEEIRRFASREQSDLGFHADVALGTPRLLAFCILFLACVFASSIDFSWALGLTVLATFFVCLLECLAVSTVILREGELHLVGPLWPRMSFALDAVRLVPAWYGMALVLDTQVTVPRFLFASRVWETLIALLSRSVGYDVTEPATEAARLAKLSQKAA